MSLLMDALSKAEKDRNKVKQESHIPIENEGLSEPEGLFFENKHSVEEKPLEEKSLDLSFLSLSIDEKKDEIELVETKEKSNLNAPLELATELPADLPLSELIEEESELSSEPLIIAEPPAPKVESKPNYNIPVLGVAKKPVSQTPWFLAGGAVLLAALLMGYYYFKSIETNTNSSITGNIILDHDSLQDQKIYEIEVETKKEVKELIEEKTAEVLKKPQTNLVTELKPVDQTALQVKTREPLASLEPLEKEETPYVQSEEPKIDYLQQALEQAYQAYQAGYMIRAEQQYQIALQYEPNHLDALLGMAVISQNLDNEQQAKTYYQKILTLNPKDSMAMSGLISMQQGTASSDSESRLKLLLSEEPDAAYLHAALGAQYVAGSRWPEANQAFLKAYHYDSNNPDYTYNLAISLDHLGQTQAAIKYYKQALYLSNQFSAGFNKSEIETRLLSLSNWIKTP